MRLRIRVRVGFALAPNTKVLLQARALPRCERGLVRQQARVHRIDIRGNSNPDTEVRLQARALRRCERGVVRQQARDPKDKC